METNNKESPELIESACDMGVLSRLAEEYILYCKSFEKSPNGDDEKKKSAKEKSSLFPNVAGFCRYLGIGRDKYERLSKSYPEEFGQLEAIFEDEALNSDVSASVLGAYLKKRLGYDGEKTERTELETGQMRLVFEHDVLCDGE